MYQVVLLRHGQSDWNHANQFTGWTDVDLTQKGAEEARQAGRFLRQAGISFDVAYTSLLKRSIRTLWIVLDELDQMWLPVIKDWRLNERHYGELQGLNKTQTAERYGKEQVFRWRRSYTVRPPLLDSNDPRHPRFDPKYGGVDPAELPAGESLQDTLERVLTCWNELILADIRQGRKVLVVAHGNSLRALVKHLDHLSDEAVPGLSIPTGIPILYELDRSLAPVQRTYIGDEDVIRAAQAAAARAAQVRGEGD